MGIPHLISTLEPFAIHDILDGQPVVIDGPALAYHILHLCNRNGIAFPSYGLLAETAVAWLDELTSRDVSVKVIYFDGHLPLAKRPVRMERMAKSFHQLRLAHSADPKGRPLAYFSSSLDVLTPSAMFTPKPPPRNPFPPPSFHVPAIIDALRVCPRYRQLIRLVPGEADAYCAQHLLDSGGVVLTSDSDLLAHDLGDGRVVFFRDIYLDGDSRIACASFSPTHMCERLGFSSSNQICRLAYERKRNPHLSLPQIQQECSKPISDGICFEEFCQEYLHHETAHWPESLKADFLDPRLSELVVQYAKPCETDSAQEDKIFLPILIEDPTRGSAWEQSTPIRELAYTILRWIIPGQSSLIHEYRRVNNTVQKGRQVSLMSKTSAEDYAKSLVDAMGQIRKTAKGDTDLAWQAFSLSLDIRHCREQEKQSHALQTLQRASGANRNKISWELLHFLAQLQAAYYSFRILHQIIALVPARKLVPELSGMLDSLPSLTKFPGVDIAIELLSRENAARIMKMVKEVVPLPDESAKPVRASQKDSKAIKRTASTAISSTDVKRKAVRNPFDILSQDE